MVLAVGSRFYRGNETSGRVQVLRYQSETNQWERLGAYLVNGGQNSDNESASSSIQQFGYSVALSQDASIMAVVAVLLSHIDKNAVVTRTLSISLGKFGPAHAMTF